MIRIAPPLAALLLVALGGTAAADVQSGRTKFVHGDYVGARADLAAVKPAERPAAGVLLARLELRLGEYAAAERRAAGLERSKNRAVAADASALLGEVYRVTGRYAQARKQLEQHVRKHPDHLRGRYLLGLVYRDLGDTARAKQTFELFVDEYNAGKIGFEDAQQSLYLGLAGRYLASFQFANDAFRDAVNLDTTLLEANIEWGHLFLEKYAASYAEQSFDEVLKSDPKHPDAHAGMARVRLEQSYDVAAARNHLTQALAINPKHLPSLLIRAELEIDSNQWDAAKATLDEVFAVNAELPEARSLLATIFWLRDDTAGFEREKARVLALNKGFAPLYHIIARSAVREHRYASAIELEEKAVALDPTYYAAMEALGTGYLRLGEEHKGLEWLRRAWEGDEYNVRTKNILDLFEDEIPKSYEFAATAHFRVRYPKQERPVLVRYVAPLLERAHADMVKRYGFTPTGPLVVELFSDPDHYSVRTVGLPNLGALGVCFGRVITSMSPSNGNINWAMVLWHELAHVFAIQMSSSRVPRWYTEGLSEYETIIARPEWRRENDVDIWAALEAGTLPSVADLNAGFLKPSMEEVLVSYHLSSVTIEYIAKTYGFPKVVDGLRLFGRGMETPEVIHKITGLTVAQFDAAFRKYLATRLAPYRGTFRLPSAGVDDVAKLEIAAAAAPNDALAHARLGLGYFYAGDADKAQAAMTRALAIDPKNKIALFVMGELELRQRNRDPARKLFLTLVGVGGDGYDVRGRLGLIAIQEGDIKEAEAQLNRAKQLDPERSDPYLMLAELYESKGRKQESLAEYERYVAIEQMQFAPVKHLVVEYGKLGRWDKVRRYGELGVDINPHDGELLLALGRAHLAGKQARRALYAFDSALIARPSLRRPALAHLGRAEAQLALRDRRGAAAALAHALKLEPANRDALVLKKRLRR
jgi:tetratricopeptide (TPR) repeat protein